MNIDGCVGKKQNAAPQTHQVPPAHLSYAGPALDHLQNRTDGLGIGSCDSVNLSVDQAFVNHHGAEDIPVLKLAAGLIHGPSFSGPHLKKLGREFLVQLTGRMIQNLYPVQRNMKLLGQHSNLTGVAQQQNLGDVFFHSLVGRAQHYRIIALGKNDVLGITLGAGNQFAQGLTLGTEQGFKRLNIMRMGWQLDPGRSALNRRLSHGGRNLQKNAGIKGLRDDVFRTELKRAISVARCESETFSRASSASALTTATFIWMLMARARPHPGRLGKYRENPEHC